MRLVIPSKKYYRSYVDAINEYENYKIVNRINGVDRITRR